MTIYSGKMVNSWGKLIGPILGVAWQGVVLSVEVEDKDLLLPWDDTVRRNERGTCPPLYSTVASSTGSHNPYSSGALTRSPSAVVATPGSVTTWWIVFPD